MAYRERIICLLDISCDIISGGRIACVILPKHPPPAHIHMGKGRMVNYAVTMLCGVNETIQ